MNVIPSDHTFFTKEKMIVNTIGNTINEENAFVKNVWAKKLEFDAIAVSCLNKESWRLEIWFEFFSFLTVECTQEILLYFEFLFHDRVCKIVQKLLFHILFTKNSLEIQNSAVFFEFIWAGIVKCTLRNNLIDVSLCRFLVKITLSEKQKTLQALFFSEKHLQSLSMIVLRVY